MDHKAVNSLKRQVRKLPLSQYLREVYLFAIQKTTPSVYTRDLNDWSANFEMQDREDVIMGWDLMNEEEIISSLLNDLRPDDVFWDVGCATGVYTCFALNVLGDNGEIIGFEPDPLRRAKAIRNVDLNGGKNRFEAWDMALSNGQNTAIISENGKQLDLSHTKEGAGVETIQGDKLIKDNQVPSPNVIKLDIEGVEVDAIQGLKDALASDSCRIVYCEVHPEFLDDRGQSEQEVYSLLEEAGFEITPLHERINKTHFIRATK